MAGDPPGSPAISRVVRPAGAGYGRKVMQDTANPLSTGGAIPPSRRPWILGAVAVYLVIMIVVGWGLTGFYRAARDRLDDTLGQRLLAVAQTLAATSDAQSIFSVTVGDSTGDEAVAALGRRFRDLGAGLDLAEITLSDPDGVVLASTAGSLVPGQKNDYWAIDSDAVDSARAGHPAATRLYTLQGSYLKSAYAPILLEVPELDQPLVAAVITVSGSPDFFDALARLRRGALLTGAAVLVSLLVLGVFLYRIQVALERYRASILRQENLAAMGRMTAGIAHEIRNPLGIIRGAGQHLQEVLAGLGRRDPIADYIPEEVDRLDRILSRYLAFGSEAPTAGETFVAAQVVDKVAHLLAGEFAAGGVDIAVDPLPGVWVRGDPLRLRQTVMNLMLNARDAMTGGGSITVTGTTGNGNLELVIRDEGCGLPAGDPEELFAPFHSRKEKGSGLGLTLSRTIVREMGGDLRLRNRSDGCGSEAIIILPVHEAGAAAPAKE